MNDLRKLLLAGLIAGVLAGCEKPPEAPKQDISVIPGKELFCLADSEAEAAEIAEQYGIELVSYQYGTAVFHTDQDPEAVISYGSEHQLPALSLNTDEHQKN